MRKKILLPLLGICIGSALLVSWLRADEVVVKSDTKLDFKDQLSASQLLHSKVLDRSGQKIGEIEDIVIDPNSGRIQFAVLKLSGDLADNGKYTPVPFALLKLSDMSAKTDVFGHRDL